MLASIFVFNVGQGIRPLEAKSIVAMFRCDDFAALSAQLMSYFR